MNEKTLYNTGMVCYLIYMIDNSQPALMTHALQALVLAERPEGITGKEANEVFRYRFECPRYSALPSVMSRLQKRLWIDIQKDGQVCRYSLTPAGREVLKEIREFIAGIGEPLSTEVAKPQEEIMPIIEIVERPESARHNTGGRALKEETLAVLNTVKTGKAVAFPLTTRVERIRLIARLRSAMTLRDCLVRHRITDTAIIVWAIAKPAQE